MTRLLGAVLALVCGTVCLAGPNAGGTLVVHNTGIAWSNDPPGLASDPPADCDSVDNLVALDVLPARLGWVWKVYAAFPEGSLPRLKALGFKTEYTEPGVVVFQGGLPDPVMDFQVGQDGWPLANGGCGGLSFGTVQTTLVSECYWFAGYAYYADCNWVTAPHTNPANALFIDDATPPNEDPIAGYSTIGFGLRGTTHWPGATTGACCLPDASCLIVTEAECLLQAGTWTGCPAHCDPNPCVLDLGACCFLEGNCVVVPQRQCPAAWLGTGTVCVPNTCPPVGACCFSDGSCVLNTQAGCVTPWIWQGGGTSCDPNPCFSGACCISLACEIHPLAECDALGGTYQGNGTLCDPYPCPVETEPEIEPGGLINPEPWHDWVSASGDAGIPIQVSIPDDLGEIEHVEFYYSTDDGGTWQLITDDTDGSEPALNTVDTTVGMAGCGWSAEFQVPDSLPGCPIQFRSVIHPAEGEPVENVTVRDYDPLPPSIGTTSILDRVVIERDALGTEVYANGAEITRVIIQRAPMDTAFVKGVPGINQLAFDSMYCAPTAAAQCLRYFETQGDTAVCGGLATSGLVEAMAAYMSTNRTVAGTLPSQWVGGVGQWIAAFGQGYSIRYYIHFSCDVSGSTWTIEDWRRIRNELELCRNVLIGVFWDGGGGHALTLDSIFYPENPDGSITIGFKDPWTGATATGNLDPATGYIASLSGAGGGRGAQIGITLLVARSEEEIGGGVAGDVVYDGQPDAFPFSIDIPIPDPGFWFVHITLVNSSEHVHRISRVIEYEPNSEGLGEQEIGMPLTFDLGKPAPNPSHDEAKVCYTVPRKVNVRLAIYDVAGREVRSLLDRESPPGRHEATWDGRDQAGKPVASGIYYLKMTASDTVRTRAIAILR